VTRYDRGRPGSARARVAAMMLLTLRGTPFLYYGEEIGMADVPVPRERRLDPGGRDPCRTPMRWEPGRTAGFTTGEPWLPVGDPDDGSVEAQRADPSSMLSLYRSLIWLRRRSSALRWGSFRPRDAGRDVFAYERASQDERLFVALNFSQREKAVGVEGLPSHGVLEASTVPGRARGPVPLHPLGLGPLEGVIVRIEPG